MLVLAHPGHWAVQLIYLAPLALLCVVLARDRLRQRRGDRSSERDDQRG